MRQFRPVIVMTFASLVMVVASCSSERRPEKLLVPEKVLTEVSGKVTVNGSPMEGIQVGVEPVSDTTLVAGGKPTGSTDAQGNFTLATLAKPGAPAGDYVLVFQKGNYSPMRRGVSGDFFEGAYSNAGKNSQNPSFKISVKEGQPLTIPAIDLTHDDNSDNERLNLKIKR